MSAGDYLAALQHAMAASLARGALRIIEERSDPAHFGNAVLVLQGTDIQFRLVADRGQFFADVSTVASPSKWVDFVKVLRLALPTGAGGVVEPWATAEDIGRCIDAHLAILESFAASQRLLCRALDE